MGCGTLMGSFLYKLGSNFFKAILNRSNWVTEDGQIGESDIFII